jgi:hypothetical protein
MSKTFLKKLASIPEVAVLLLIRLYQSFLSPDQGILATRSFTCRFYPTCSHYTLQAIKKFGIVKGVFLGVKRIARCHPFNHGGWDPVPENFKI